MIVYNKTNLSASDATNLLVKTSKNEYLKKFIFVALIIAAGIPIMIYGLVNKNTIYISFGAIFVAFAIVLLVFNVVMMRKIPKVVKEKNPEVCEYGINYEFKFREHSVIIVATSDNKSTKLEYSYNILKRIYEYDDKYQLKFQGDVTLFVDKNGFQDKKMEEFFRKNISTSNRKIIKK